MARAISGRTVQETSNCSSKLREVSKYDEEKKNGGVEAMSGRQWPSHIDTECPSIIHNLSYWLLLNGNGQKVGQ